MTKEKFGIAVVAEIAREVDELVAECDDLGASRSEIVEAILTAFVQSEANHAERVREIIALTKEIVGSGWVAQLRAEKPSMKR